LGIRQLKGPHTGENQAEIIIEIIKDYEIEDRVGYFVTDNASNNDTAVDAVLRSLCPHLTSAQRVARRLRCLGHVINLAAKAFLYGKDFDVFEKDINNVRENSELLKELDIWRKRGPVGKLHNVIVFICRSPQRRERFADIKGLSTDDKSNFDHLNLVVDNATRWNSLYLMIDRALKLKDRIDTFCVDNADELHGALKDVPKDQRQQRSLSNDVLKKDDWEALAEIKTILIKFWELSVRAEGTKIQGDRGVLSDYMTTLNTLLNHVRGWRDDLNIRADDEELSTPAIQHLKACIVNCWVKLDEYFVIVDETPALYASVVTTPHMKWFYFEHTWQHAHTWKDAKQPRQWLPKGKKALLTLWNEYKTMQFSPGELQVCGEKRGSEIDSDPFDDDTDMTRIQTRVQIDELEAWISAACFKLDDGDTLPKYWLRQRRGQSTARLAQMGLDMVSIPAMSSECERVFSQAKLLITGQRSSLKVDIIEATQCLRMWLIMDRKKTGKWSGKGNWDERAVPDHMYGDGED
jgi:hypothetical protein